MFFFVSVFLSVAGQMILSTNKEQHMQWLTWVFYSPLSCDECWLQLVWFLSLSWLSCNKIDDNLNHWHRERSSNCSDVSSAMPVENSSVVYLARFSITRIGTEMLWSQCFSWYSSNEVFSPEMIGDLRATGGIDAWSCFMTWFYDPSKLWHTVEWRSPLRSSLIRLFRQSSPDRWSTHLNTKETIWRSLLLVKPQFKQHVTPFLTGYKHIQ
jgi:hypothetical protein